MKRILDTVHGYIMVDEKFVEHIVDTRLFQRLRRVEQTSIRAVYPSARHDRFIHSLGVFHIGSLIVSQLREDARINKNWGETEASLEVVYGSYLAACLLHDIAHAPFSHSFESYYGQKRFLANQLKQILHIKRFSRDLDKTIKNDEPNFHEYASAIVVLKEFKSSLTKLGYDSELVVRMITGVRYYMEEGTHQIQNCFISLLHGAIIDADRLDYACRDVWASGYCTSSIDLRRLISALHIKKKDDNYEVCFESNSLNEIEGVLNVKDFQAKFVINHHVVVYEQYLLQQAAEHMAQYFFPAGDEHDDNPGYTALNKIVSINSLINEVVTDVRALRIRLLSDDDIVYLMKQTPSNHFYDEWSSRQYRHFALWKSKDEFHHYFPKIDKSGTLKNARFNQTIIDTLTKNGYKESDIQINEVKIKCRVPLKSLYLVVANEVVSYTDIKPKEDEERSDIIFYYVFIAKRGIHDIEKVKEERKTLVELLKKPLESIY